MKDRSETNWKPNLLVKYLVSLGADIRAQDDLAVRYASWSGNLELVKYLLSLGAPDSR